jgi:hypothetical protein
MQRRRAGRDSSHEAAPPQPSAAKAGRSGQGAAAAAAARQAARARAAVRSRFAGAQVFLHPPLQRAAAAAQRARPQRRRKRARRGACRSGERVLDAEGGRVYCRAQYDG